MTVSLLATEADPRAEAAAGGPEAGTEAAPLLTVSGLSVSYGRVRALDGIDLGVRTGELVALAGENGPGKTTLVRCTPGDVVPATRDALPPARRSPPPPAPPPPPRPP